MEKNKNVAPENWKGYRNIDEKDPLPSMDFIKQEYDDEVNGEPDIDDNGSI